MGRGFEFDQVYLDEVIIVSSPADPGYIEELRRKYRTEPDDAVRELWEWFDQANPSLGQRSTRAITDLLNQADVLIDKMDAEAKGEPWRIRNTGHMVVEGCVLHERADPILSQVLRELNRRAYDHSDIPPCLAGPNHLSRRTHA